MGRIPNHLRDCIAANIRHCRFEKFPGRGGSKKCAEAFGVSPQQWSPWEKGKRTPDEERLESIAVFFGKTVEWMRADHKSGEMPNPEPNRPSNHIPPGAPPLQSQINRQLLCQIMNHAAQVQCLCARALSEGTAFPDMNLPMNSGGVND